MSTNYKSIGVLILSAFAAAACSGTMLNPSHYGKYDFEGQVKDETGKPIAHAWVKVRDWETLTDDQGRWQQHQIIHCGALNDHMAGFDEEDNVLITANGYDSKEESFKVLHPAWFESCNKDQRIIFETVLSRAGTSSGQKEEDQKQPELPLGGTVL